MANGDGLSFGPTAATTPDDGLGFAGYPQPPTVPPDPTRRSLARAQARTDNGPVGQPDLSGLSGQRATRAIPMLAAVVRCRRSLPRPASATSPPGLRCRWR